MVAYEHLLSTLVKQVRHGGEGRHMSASLSRDLLSTCSHLLTEAVRVLSPPREPSSRAAGLARPSPPAPSLNPETARSVFDGALELMATHPHRRASLKGTNSNRIVMAMFTFPSLFNQPGATTMSKDVVTALLTGGDLQEQTSTQLILAMHILVRYEAGSAAQVEARPHQHRDDDAARRAHRRETPTPYAAAFLAAGSEVVSRLHPHTAGAATPVSAPAPRKAGRTFQRRRAKGEVVQPPTAAVGGASPLEPAPNMEADGPEEEEGETESVRSMCRTSTTVAVTDAELALLVAVLLRAAEDRTLIVDEQELHRLLEATANSLPDNFLIATEAQKASRNAPRLFSQILLLLGMACFPPGPQRLRAAGLRGLAALQHEHSRVMMESLTGDMRNRLGADAIRLLLFYDRQTRQRGEDRAAEADEDGVLAAFPCIMQLLFRQDAGAPANPYDGSTEGLQRNYQAQLLILVLRVYKRHIGAAKRSSPASLSVSALRELDLVAEAAWRRVRETGPAEERNSSSGSGGNDGDRYANLFSGIPVLAETELQAVSLIAHHYTKDGGGLSNESTQRLLRLASSLLRESDRVLLYVREWTRLLEALAIVLVEQESPQMSAEAAELFCGSVQTLTRLFALPDDASSMDSKAPFFIHMRHNPLSVLLLLKRLWFHDFQNVREEEWCGPIRESILGLLRVCVTLSSNSSTSVPATASGTDTGIAAAAAIQLLLAMENDSGDRHAEPAPLPTQKTPPPPAVALEERGPSLSQSTLRAAIASSLERFSRADAGQATVGIEPLHVLETVNNMFHLGLFDARLMELSVLAIRNTCSPAKLTSLSWRSRALVVRRCLQVYTIVEPHFSSLGGCRLIGKQCLVVATRLCLEKYVPQRTPSSDDNGADEAAAAHCAALVWALCVKAVQKPLRKSSLDKYLVVMTRFVRRYWAEPPREFATAAASTNDTQDKRIILRDVEQQLSESLQARRTEAGSRSASRRASNEASPAALSASQAIVAGLAAYNDTLHHMASQLLPLTYAIQREDREVRGRKIKRYYELYFTACFLLVKHNTAVVPSVWFAALQHAVSFPKLFSSTEHFHPMLSKTLELAAREVLQYATANRAVVPWAQPVPAAASKESNPHADVAAVGHANSTAPSFVLTPAVVGRVLNVIGHINNVEARITLLQLSQAAIELPPRELQVYHPARAAAQAEASATDAAEAEAGLLRRMEREKVHLLLNTINGLRAASKRTRRM